MWSGKFEVTAVDAPDHDALWREPKPHFRDLESLLNHLLDVASASSSREPIVKALPPSGVFDVASEHWFSSQVNLDLKVSLYCWLAVWHRLFALLCFGSPAAWNVTSVSENPFRDCVSRAVHTSLITCQCLLCKTGLYLLMAAPNSL